MATTRSLPFRCGLVARGLSLGQRLEGSDYVPTLGFQAMRLSRRTTSAGLRVNARERELLRYRRRVLVACSPPTARLAPVANDLVGTRMPPTGGRTEWLEVDGAVLDLGHLAPDAGPALDRRLDDIAWLYAVESHPCAR
jgi:hypothetical protein